MRGFGFIIFLICVFKLNFLDVILLRSPDVINPLNKLLLSIMIATLLGISLIRSNLDIKNS